MSNRDDFWTTLAAGHTNTVLAGALDSHLSGKSIGESFGSVRTLTDKMRAANALSLPVEAGTKVVFAGGLGAHLSYDDSPAKGGTGEVVTVKSATGDITHHEGKVFVKWDDGKFRGIHAEHLRVAGQGKVAVRGAVVTIQRRGSSGLVNIDVAFSKRGGQWFPTSIMDAAGNEYTLTKTEMSRALREVGKQASVIRVASLGDLTQFLKRADGKLVHKSSNDLWSYSKDADGNFLVERLFDGEGEPLKG